MHVGAKMVLLGLDLFSGVGGIAYAIGDVVKPVAYCDWEVEARDVLAARMRSGHIPQAPICNDVRELTPQWLKKHAGSGVKPDAIMAGFPCVGFSTAGSRKGFENEESKMFFEILRIIDDFPSVKVLFLENVPGVIKNGMGVIAQELCKKRGFNLMWTLMSACEVGAPQKRRRWYAIAYKGNKKPVLGWNQEYEKRLPSTWNLKRAPVRMVLKKPHNRIARHRLLGNSVVPAAIRQGYKNLTAPGIKLKASASGKIHAHGAILQDAKTQKWVMYKHAVPMRVKCPDFKLAFNPTLYEAPPNAVRTDKTLTTIQHAKVFATPTTSYHATYFLTPRNANMLATQLRFEINTPNHLRTGYTNVEFVEWLMGYPIGFTVASKAKA